MDTSYLISIGVLALISASTCFAAIKLGICNSDWSRTHVLMFLSASLSMLALHFCSDLPIDGSPVLQMPGGIFAVLPVLAIATWILGRRMERPNIFGAAVIGCIVLAAAHYLSFPWANRGNDGWIALGIILAASIFYITCMHTQGGERPTQAIIWWAAHSITCIPLLLNVKAVGHIEILMLVLTPIAIMGFVSWPLGQALFRLRLGLFIGVTLALFLGNAVIRYVPAYDDPAFITQITVYSPLLLLVSASALALSNKSKRSGKIIAHSLAALCLIAAAALAIFAYTYEGEAEESGSSEWDYSNF